MSFYEIVSGLSVLWYGLFGGGLFISLGLVAMARGLRDTPLSRAPAVLWRNDSILAGLFFGACGVGILLISATVSVDIFVSARLSVFPLAPGATVFLGGMLAGIMLILRSRRRHLTEGEAPHDA
jgi:hypothetical protein